MVTYEMYKDANDSGWLDEASELGYYISHIDEIKKPDESNPLKDVVLLSECGVERELIVNFIEATLNQDVKVSNPSALKNWRGWKSLV